jgi:signal transduction histidine kinase
VIEVADGGCGVPAEALERLFERFARADQARTRAHGGAGLGLAIVNAIAVAHRGECTVRTSPAGSTFSLRLPRFRPQRPARLLPAPAPVSAGAYPSEASVPTGTSSARS